MFSIELLHEGNEYTLTNSCMRPSNFFVGYRMDKDLSLLYFMDSGITCGRGASAAVVVVAAPVVVVPGCWQEELLV